MLTAVYRLSNITTQITVWEITVIQFVCRSEKPIVYLEQKLSGSESDLCPIKQRISLSLMTGGTKSLSVHPMKSMNM